MKSHADGQHSSRAAFTPLGSLTEGVEIQNQSAHDPFSASRTNEYLSATNPQRQVMSLGMTGLMEQDVPIQSPFNMISVPGPSTDQVPCQMQTNPVRENHGSDNANSVLANDLWNEHDLEWPTWSVSSDFDIQAINSSIAATIFMQQEQPLNFEQGQMLTKPTAPV